MKRYPGVPPFTTRQANIFFGRDYDIEMLQKLISLRKQVLLYSKSGLGKTSLLNAGVLPKLEGKFTVLKIRFFAYIKNISLSPIDTVIEVIKATILNVENLPNTILDDLILDEQYKKSLWFLFKKIQLFNRTRFILVFDQFEELFSYPVEQIELFKNQLHELLYIDVPDNYMQLIANKAGFDEHKQIDALYEKIDLRTVYAIRSDRLSLLNHLADKIPDIQKTFYELKPLELDQAKLAIVNPANAGANNNETFETEPFNYDENAVDTIIQKLSVNGTQAIDITQLQIVCQRIETIVAMKQNETLNSRKVVIIISDLPEFNDIYKNFYKEAVNKTKEPEKVRKFIEDQLIGKNQRISLDSINCEYFVNAETLQNLVDTRLLDVEPNSTGGYNYELSHDNLIEPILEEAKQRRQQEADDLKVSEELDERKRIEKLRAKYRNIILVMSALIIFPILVYITSNGWYSSYKNSEELKDLLLKFVPTVNIDNPYKYASDQVDYYLLHGDEKPYERPDPYAEVIKYLTIQKISKDLPKGISREMIENQIIDLKKCSELLLSANQNYYNLNFKTAVSLYQDVIQLKSKIKTPFYMKEFCKSPLEHFMVDVCPGKYKMDSFFVVNISRPFKISKFEITNAQYARFLTEYKSDTVKEGDFVGQRMINLTGKFRFVKCHIEKKDTLFVVEQGYECFPVVYVSWFGAYEYCRYYGGQLPTEAQWEYAAAGGHKLGKDINNRYIRHFDYAGSDTLLKVGWFDSNSDQREHLVGSLKANQLGLFDMSGNVWEWCYDWYMNEYPKGEIEDYSNNIKANQRVVRGGAFNFIDTINKCCSVNMRGTYRPTYVSSLGGFRIVFNK